MKKIIITALFFAVGVSAHAGILISEVTTTASGGDWVELICTGNVPVDISKYLVTMYYGTNESLSTDPITLYPSDRNETPYDDRFCVVYLTAPGKTDETDYTGDTNRNGHIDVYCSNYSASLWNEECVVAVDDDDDPANGMIDFICYSNNDGDLSDTIAAYTEKAISNGEWTGSPVTESIMIPIPVKGLEPYQSISRRGTTDTNKAGDFYITGEQTPGRENMDCTTTSTKELISIEKDHVTVVPNHPYYKGIFRVYVSQKCDISMRVFSTIGEMMPGTITIDDAVPGPLYIEWKSADRVPTGLYLVKIEAVSSGNRQTTVKRGFFIVSRYK